METNTQTKIFKAYPINYHEDDTILLRTLPNDLDYKKLNVQEIEANIKEALIYRDTLISQGIVNKDYLKSYKECYEIPLLITVPCSKEHYYHWYDFPKDDYPELEEKIVNMEPIMRGAQSRFTPSTGVIDVRLCIPWNHIKPEKMDELRLLLKTHCSEKGTEIWFPSLITKVKKTRALPFNIRGFDKEPNIRRFTVKELDIFTKS